MSEADGISGRLMVARATVLGLEVALLKACGWSPVGAWGQTGQQLIDAGEVCRWSPPPGVRDSSPDEPWEHDEAVWACERALVERPASA